MRKKSENIFHKLIDHINVSWLIRKKFAYPFGGRDLRDLKNLSRIFQEWGCMSLWDAFLASDSDWVKKSGYSIGAFQRCIPWLVDVPGWKEKAAKYEIQIAGSYPKEVAGLIEEMKLNSEKEKRLR